MSAIRVKSKPVAAIRPTNMGRPLTNAQPRKPKGSPLPIIIVLTILGVGGFFGWKVFSSHRAAALREKEERERKQKANEAEWERQRREALERAAREAERRNQSAKPVEEEVVVEKPKVREKTETEILQEDAAARKAMLPEIENARRNPAAKALNGFAGVRFGEPLEKAGAPVKWGTVLPSGDSVAARGAAFAVNGPRLEKPFLSLGTTPLVWVTPKTRKPYRIEFTRPLALAGEAKHDAETTNLVAFISKRYACKPFVLGPNRPERKGCEYVFPIGPGTISIVEQGADLTFAMEREDLKKEALEEAEALRKESMQVATEDDGKILDSGRYPNGGLDRKRYPGIRLKDETPRMFCGIVFASQPPESARVIVPQKGAKGFDVDYARTKCRPFLGFTRGRADIDSYRGGVYAVRLFSQGGSDGLNDGEYFEKVKATLKAHYKVEPKEKKGELEFPELTFTVGDLDIVFGPDARGGFYLNATNQVLAKMAETDPSALARPSKARK